MKKMYSDMEVVSFVKNIHYKGSDFIEGDIQERIESYDNYELKEIDVNELETPSYYVDEELIKEYLDMDISKTPPLVLGYYNTGEYQTIDGGHRTTVLKKLGITKVLAYVGIE
ncbi:TPA: hypothetical protein ACTZ3A_000936 [Bacillus cereus]